MSTPTRALRGAKHPFRKNVQELQKRNYQRIHRLKIHEITTLSNTKDVMMNDAVEEEGILPENYQKTLQTLPDDVLLEIALYFGVKEVQFFTTCKSFYHLYDQWILSMFGGHHEI